LKNVVNGVIDDAKSIGGGGTEGIKGSLDMASIFGGGDEEEGAFEMTSVMARKVPVEKVTSPLHEDVG
jgi:hypothetical protein